MPLRFDLVFSYWIFIWYIIYAFRITHYSPKFAIALGLLDNIVMLILMILYGTRVKTIFIFVVINIFIKVIPYYLINKSITIQDVYATFILFLIFILWLHINNKNLTGNIKIIYDSLLKGEDNTPFMNLLKKIEINYKNM